MKELRAFVGHSFNEHDRALVQIFCEHFDTLAKSHLDFTWDHAIDAEPSPLSQKVLAKIEGKNVFIGICTRQELAIQDASLRRGFLQTNALSADEDKFRWKTSDWIIQEIGLAVGRNMSIIIFLEENVREPGGLYGDIEYIPFARANPQASFDKLLQMLVSLTPRAPINSTADAEPPPSDNAKQARKDTLDLEPNPGWTEERYNSALFDALALKDEGALTRISEAFRASKYSAGVGAAEWDGQIEWLKVLFARDGDFGRLRQLAEEHPGSSRLQNFLARGYAQLGEHRKAAEAFERASHSAEDPVHRARRESNAAIEYAHAGELSQAFTVFDNAKRMARAQSSAQEAIVGDLRTLAQIEKNDELELAALEHATELNPANWRSRFELAYKHSQCDNNDMAFYHYTRIPERLRDSAGWNNLGVAYANFSMRAKSIEAFRRAEGMRDTLAMSNLGFKFLRAGFVEEATKLANAALDVENYHSNITDLLKQLRESPEEETKKEVETLEAVKAKAAFYRDLGKAALADTPTEIASKWHCSSPDTALEASLDGNDVRIIGSYIEEENASLGLLGGIARRKVTRHVQYALKLRGNILTGEVKRSTEGETSPSMLSLGLTNRKVAMYFQANRTELRVMEGLQFQTFKCIN